MTLRAEGTKESTDRRNEKLLTVTVNALAAVGGGPAITLAGETSTGHRSPVAER